MQDRCNLHWPSINTEQGQKHRLSNAGSYHIKNGIVKM